MKKCLKMFFIVIFSITLLTIIGLKFKDSSAYSFDTYDWSKLSIGTYLDYLPIPLENTYILSADYTGYEENQEISAENLDKWRIISMDKEAGTVEIISDKATSATVILKGAQGYNNGVYLLNDICRKLYSNATLGVTARSINEMDFLSKLTDDVLYKDYVTERADGLRYKYGDVVEYESHGTYPTQWLNDSSDSEEDYIVALSKSRTLIEKSNEKNGRYNDAISTRNSDYVIENWETAFQRVSSGTAYRNILLFDSDWHTLNYWVASRYVSTTSETQVIYGLKRVNGNLFSQNFGGSENWWSNSGNFSVRPIVTIPVDYINTFNGDGTQNSPYTIEKTDQFAIITFKDKKIYDSVLEQIDSDVIYEKKDNYLRITFPADEITKIKRFDLSNLNVSDISGLGKFTSLTELYLNNNNLTNISELETLTNLKTLEIYGNTINDISPLRNITTLERLNVSKNKFFDNSGSTISNILSNLTNLTELDLSHNLLITTVGLENLTKLKKLNLFDNAVTNFSGLRTLINLEVLNLGENNEQNNKTFTNLDSLNNLTKLKELNFSTNYTPTIANNLTNLINLETLDISRNNIKNENIDGKLNNLTKLKEINLSFNSLKLLTPLLSVYSLQYIYVYNNNLENLTGVLNNNTLIWPNLKKINLASNFSVSRFAPEIVYLKNLSNSHLLEFDYNYLTDTSSLPHVDENGISYVTYDDFDARCDGEYDDFIAIRNAHEFANMYGYEVRATEGKTYHIYKYEDFPVTVFTNVDWKNANFIIHDEIIENKYVRNQNIFRISNTNRSDIVEINNPNFTINRQTKRIPELYDTIRNLNYKGYSRYLVIVTNSNKKHFIRYGMNSDSGADQQDSFIMDSGCMLYNDVMWDFDNITKIRIIPIPKDQGYIKNGNFTTNYLLSQSETSYTRLNSNKTIYILRNIYLYDSANITLSNINHTLSRDVLSGSYAGFINANTVADLRIENMNLHEWKYIHDGRSSYDLSLTTGVNVYLYNIKTTTSYARDRWGITGTNYLKDVIVDNCVLNRVDAHKGIYNLKIKNSTIGANGITVDGAGKLRVENVIMMSGALLSLRGDYGSFWDGDIYIKDTTFMHNSQWSWTMFNVNIEGLADGHDFGYPTKFPNVYMENITFDNQLKPSNEINWLFTFWNQAIAENVPESYFNSKIFINGFKFINGNSSNPILRLCTLNLDNMVGNYVFTNTKFVDGDGNDLTHRLNIGEQVVVTKNVRLTVEENATAQNVLTIYKDNRVVVNNETITGTYNYLFDEVGTYKVKLNSLENYYHSKTGEKIFEFTIRNANNTNKNTNEAFKMAKKLGIGYNLGNSFDAMLKERGFLLDSETMWGNPTVTKGQIDKIKELGFNTIRIGVSYYNHIEKDGTIDINWLKRIKEIVDYAYANDMYVIINCHHDTGMNPILAWIFSDEKTYNKNLNDLLNIWSQVAEFFKGYDQKLLFEFLGEIMTSDISWNYYTKLNDLKLVHEINQKLIYLVRNTGGNNAKRFLIVCPYAGSTDNIPLDTMFDNGFEDTIADHLLAEVHDYSKGDTNIKSVFDRINSYVEKYNIPFIVGEFGTNDTVDEELRLESATSFAKYSSTYNIPVLWWDNGDNFKLFDRNTLEVTQSKIVEILNKYVKQNDTNTDTNSSSGTSSDKNNSTGKSNGNNNSNSNSSNNQGNFSNLDDPEKNDNNTNNNDDNLSINDNTGKNQENNNDKTNNGKPKPSENSNVNSSRLSTLGIIGMIILSLGMLGMIFNEIKKYIM